MTAEHTRNTFCGDDEVAEVLRELGELADAALTRVEPVLRRWAEGADEPEFTDCGWCPLCAAAALLCGHHDLVGRFAGHAMDVVTVLRETIAGMPSDSRSGFVTPERPASPVYQPIAVTVKRSD